MWHCAAATALWQCQNEEQKNEEQKNEEQKNEEQKNEEQKTIASYPITIIGMKEYMEANDGVLAVFPDVSLKRGTNTYDYFHSIQIPAFLARINKLDTKLDPFGQNIACSLKYSETIGNLYCEHYSKPETVCRRMWDMTPETVCRRMWDMTPESNKDPNKETFALPVGVEEPVSLATKKLFEEQFIPETPKSDITPLPFGEGPMLHLWASTTITMQYLHEQENRSHRIKYLQGQLGMISWEDSSWVKGARILINKLRQFASDEGIDGKDKRRILLFNYRIGDVNKQHDANIDLLKSVIDIAKERNQFVVVPLIVHASDAEVREIENVTTSILVLYKGDKPYDKRYTAAFWAFVANELQDIVHGVIGGRSGSMDIASFMGVNTCSFDEPVFGPHRTSEHDPYEKRYICSQGGQLLRLLSQHAIMSVVYVDTSSWVSKKRDNGTKYNSYTKLDEEGLKTWLDREPSSPHISPELTADQIRVRCTRSVVSATLIYHFLERACRGNPKRGFIEDGAPY
jgi:hypothetical protein